MSKYYAKQSKTKRFRKSLLFLTIIIILISFIAVIYKSNKLRPILSKISSFISPSKKAETASLQDKPEKILPWPSYGQSAYGEKQDNTVYQSAQDLKPVPIASVAKIITALAVLEKKPLKPGESGPNILITEKDIEFYNEHLANLGTVVPVNVGEEITQYQALQAMLQPSANNIADTLAVWAFGSKENYINYANNMLQKLYLQNTKVADPSGYSPNTVSIAPELVKLGFIYLENPVLIEIAKQPSSTIPIAGEIKNYNASLNEAGIVGIKIGFTDEAGRTFIATDLSNSKNPKVAVVLGAESLPQVMQDTINILKSN